MFLPTFLFVLNIFHLTSARYHARSISQPHPQQSSFLTLNTVKTKKTDLEIKKNTMQVTIEEAWSPTAKWHWSDSNSKGIPPMKREGHSAVALDNMLIVFGGCYLDKQCFNDVNVYFTNKNVWVPVKTVGLPPTEREGHTATIVGDRMVVYGGSSQLGYLGDVYILKTSLSVGSGEELIMAWGRPDVGVSTMTPSGREGHSATLVDSRIFYIGGYTEKGFTNELLVLDTASMSWEEPHVSSLKPPAREGHSANLYNDRIYLWGGFTDGGCLQDLWILDVNMLAWEVGTAMGVAPVAREDHATVVRGNELLIAAGCNFGKRNCFADLHVLDLDAMTWRAEVVASTGVNLTPREAVTMNVVQGEIYLFGGCYLSQQCFSDLVVLKPSEGKLKCGGESPKGACSGHGECRVYLQEEEEQEEKEKKENLNQNESFVETSSSSTTKGFIKALLKKVRPQVGHSPSPPPVPNVTKNDTAPMETNGTEPIVIPKEKPLLDASGYKQTYMCQCSTGWQGDQCELPAKCPLQCSGHGTCVAGGYCMCVLSWVGTACERPRAMSIELCPLQCSGHGTCHSQLDKSIEVLASNASIASNANVTEGNVSETTNKDLTRFRERDVSFKTVGSQRTPIPTTLTETLLKVQQSEENNEKKNYNLLDVSDQLLIQTHQQSKIRTRTFQKSALEKSALEKSDIVDGAELTDDTEPKCKCVDGWSGMACDRNLIVKEDEEEEKINTSTVDTTPTAPVNATEGLVHTKFKRVKSHTKAKDAMAGSTVMSMKKAAAVQTLTNTKETKTNTKSKTKTSTPKSTSSLTIGTPTYVNTVPMSCHHANNCNSHGICQSGRCYCHTGFQGVGCETMISSSSLSSKTISRRLKSFVAFDSTWHWVPLCLMSGSLIGFFAPWKKCYKDKRGRDWRYR